MLRPLILLFASAFVIPHSSFSAQPNVLVILADDLGWSDTTLHGTTTLYQTPNLERLAKRGMTFTRAYSASPLCSPTRSALLTGQSPTRTGITVPNCHVPQVVLQATTGKKAPVDQKAIQPDPVTRLKTEYRTLAETLKDAGYSTAHFGKWHLGPEPYSPLQQGFDVDLPHHPGPGPAGSFVAPWKFANFKEKSPSEHIEDRMAVEAVAWMEQQKAKPFYLNYWMFSVHAPFDAKKANIEMHRARIDPKDAQRSPTYAAMIQSMDDAIGTLLDGLDKLKLADNTIIIFTADNGGNMYNEVDGTTPTSNRPLRGGKATMFEGGTRVPCVVVWPGIAASGSRSDAIIQSEDYYPTLLEGLALKPADGQRFDGHSILPALKGDALAGKAVFQYFPHNPGVPDWLPPSVSVHRDDWKLIRIFHGGEKGAHRHLLFNLRDDLGEKNNLAAQKPELVTELDAMIEKFLSDTKAVVPVPNQAFDPSKYRPELEGKQQPKGKAKAPTKPASKGKDDGDPALQGWKARDCKASVKDGILRITNIGSECFLGFSAGKHSGPTTAKFRIKAKAGTNHFDWLPGGVGSQQQRTDFTLRGGDWEEITVELPAEGLLGIVRLYLPMQEQPVEIDWIELASKNGGKPTRTGF
ncbi:sulfatase [Prosthecobacter sp.]|uniref:sulfatase n=1 Tax=Prosthecobacter sp. TaxID=1965333 RepID=UPI002ABBC682|nr:sulfatase [Prosthecobacter sp.]MDZ4402531.1 sulfatase [Prosthecobacter sp.]